MAEAEANTGRVVMADRNSDGIKRWMGFKADEQDEAAPVTNQGGSLTRIRELEAQLADLRSRRDITSLSKEEFEILATETAMSLIRTAQQREAKANLSAERILTESKRAAQGAVEAAESKARSLLGQAESKGRRLIEAAENDAREFFLADFSLRFSLFEPSATFSPRLIRGLPLSSSVRSTAELSCERRSHAASSLVRDCTIALAAASRELV